ncbi:MAG TPA: energy-coupled thiamine transporter ThiT [Bacillota bacterium]|nr:energy-coupled thiamine transporter ThiT [Bacillota bacterium]HOR84872.1 energy-coupled thiamine transporter ThiT [Bacillota bacterium]HPL52557.1 energy-coupled thiamine transporter ThiT [Bacillota bacterium]
MKRTSTKMLTEAGIMIAAAQILSYVKIFEAPYGGSVTAGSMIPIIVFSLRWGAKYGLLAGTAYGILQFLLGGAIYSYHIISILFDYVVAFGLLGLAGIFRTDAKGIFLGTCLGIFGRFICHIISGVVVWASYAPEGMNPLHYSIVYNGSYLLPELAITLVIVGVLYKPLIKNIGQRM